MNVMSIKCVFISKNMQNSFIEYLKKLKHFDAPEVFLHK